MKRIISLILVFCITATLFASMPLNVNAAISGVCGENLTWTLDNKGILVISGTGSMFDWGYLRSPWGTGRIKEVIIGSGVTSIGEWAFGECRSLTSITIPDSVTSIGDDAFEACVSLTSITIPDSVTSIGDGAFANCFDWNDIL